MRPPRGGPASPAARRWGHNQRPPHHCGRYHRQRAGEVVGVQYRFRPPTRRPEDNGAPPPRYRRDTADGMIIERDVAIGVRGGVTVYADVFRPADERPAPPLIAWSPYGKHAGSQVTERYPDGGVAPGQLSGYTAFESPDPLYWTARGYAIVNADIPGSWHSGGNATFLSPEEAACGHDLVEWAAAQPWSNGKVGMSGVSYLTSAQWTIAATNPPHLAAINPWEGWSDTYREVARHGGIPETYFWPYIGRRSPAPAACGRARRPAARRCPTTVRRPAGTVAGPRSTCVSPRPPTWSATPSCACGCRLPSPATWMSSWPCKSSTA